MKESKGLPHRTKVVVPVLAAVIVVVLGIVLKAGRQDSPHVRHDAPPVEAVVMTVRASVLPDEVSASGTVRPVLEAKIAPKIMSNVAEVTVREGDRVSRGQVLIRLESRDLEAQVVQAQAALSAALAGSRRAVTAVDLQRAQTSTGIAGAEAALKAAMEQFGIVREGARRQEKAQAQLAVAEAEAHLKNAEVELGRMKRLFDQGVIARQRLDAAQTSYDVVRAQHESAKQHAEMVAEGSRQQEVRAAEERVRQAEEALRMAKASSLQNRMSSRSAEEAHSQVAQSRAALQYAQVQLGYATIRAPMSGVVTARLVDPGDTVSPGVPMMAVEDNSLYRLEAAVPERDLSTLHIGGRVAVTIGSDRRAAEGTVSVISPSGDPGSRKFMVKVDLPRGLAVRSGEFGRISFPVSYSSGITVPDSAIRSEGGLTFVYVVGREGRAKMQVVKTGRGTEGGIEVISGLNPGDRLVIESTGTIADGVTIKAREA